MGGERDGRDDRGNGSRPPVTLSKARAIGVAASKSARILRERAKCLPKGRGEEEELRSMF